MILRNAVLNNKTEQNRYWSVSEKQKSCVSVSGRIHLNSSPDRVCLVILWKRSQMSLLLKCIGFYFTVYCLPLPLLLTDVVSPSHLKHSRTDRTAPNDLCSAPEQNTQNALSSKQNTDNKWSCGDRAINEHNQKDNKHCKWNCVTDGGNMYYCEQWVVNRLLQSLFNVPSVLMASGQMTQ